MRWFRCVLIGLAVWIISIFLPGCGENDCTAPNGNGSVPARILDIWPKWSSVDTTVIAYTYVADTWEELQQYGPYSAWIVDIVSLEKEFVAEGIVHDWSPDGRQLLLGRAGDSFWLIDLADGEECLLPVGGANPDFSPDGRRIAFHGGEETTGTWILSLDSMAASWISKWGHADWAPSGDMLVCDSLVMIREDGTRIGRVEIDHGFGGPWYPRWSPEGEMIAYGAYCQPRGAVPGDPGIWTVTTEGVGQALVACPGAVVSWAPNGRWLTYGARSTDGKSSVIWIVNSDGTDKRQVTFH